jgi:hypothetical protein
VARAVPFPSDQLTGLTRVTTMRRILALDGGGVRGIFTLQILARIEALLREDTGRPELRLADVFDLFAGTSTGAIIATCLSWGMTVAEIERMYLDFGPLMFHPEPWYRQWRSRYRADTIAGMFKDTFREDDADRSPALMGSKRLRTTLLTVMRNATTGSPWPVTNHPAALYNDRSRDDCNLNVPLWKLLRASTAAPMFFPPERIEYGTRRFLFVDGGITPFNNPALIAVLTATLPQYRIGWPTGREALHVISVGTGTTRAHLPSKLAEKINLIDQFDFLVPALIDAAAVQQDLLCRILGDCLFGERIDRELGDVATPTLLGAAEQKFSYVRYDQLLDDVERAPGQPRLDLRLDRIESMPALQQLGRDYAAAHVTREHLYPRAATTSAA